MVIIISLRGGGARVDPHLGEIFFTHVCFKYLFGDTSIATAVVLAVQGLLVTAQLVILVRAHVWYHLISQVVRVHY